MREGRSQRGKWSGIEAGNEGGREVVKKVGRQ